MTERKQNALQPTGGLAQAGQWLAQKIVRIWKFLLPSERQ